MAINGQVWAIILAAGEGLRLRSLTTDAEGRIVPKQFCSLHGERTILGDAIERARQVVDDTRIVPIVAAEHRRLWEGEWGRPLRDNVVVQPRNRGTAPGILLPLLSILERDPDASVVILPSDHHVERESLIAVALRMAFHSAICDPATLVILGMTPDSADCEYGWIVPESGTTALRPVRRFVEKPEPDLARELFESGALWSSFILVARGRTLLDQFTERLPDQVAALWGAFAVKRSERQAALDHAYEHLQFADFSRSVLTGSEPVSRVLETPPCGWTDLGTPARVAECLAHERFAVRSSPCRRPSLVLARALALQGGGT